MPIEFGKNARKQVVRGDIVASFQYVWNEDQRQHEPAMCMWRLATAGKRNKGKVSPGCFVVCLSRAYKYVAKTEEETAYLVHQSMIAAQVMGFEVTKGVTHRIADFIQDMLIELVTMKPLPAELSPKIGTPEVTIDAKGAAHVVLH